MSGYAKKPLGILVCFVAFIWFFIIAGTITVILIDKKARKENLAFPGQAANTLRIAFGINFVEWLETKLYHFTDFRKRFLLSLIGVKIQVRDISNNQAFTRNAQSNNIQNNVMNPASQREISANFPSDIEPYFQGSPLPGEGKWSTEGLPLINGKPVVYKTILRVDPKRPYAIVDIACIDAEKVYFHLVAGSHYIGVNGERGTGSIYYLDRPKLVASMNGGFLPAHRTGGMIIDGKVFLPMESKKATIIIYKDDTLELVEWKKSMISLLPRIKHARQNLEMLLINGNFNTRATYWGIVKPGEDPIYNWRSAIGLTKDRKRLVFAAGNDLSPKSLALALKLAGCETGMHMDMNVSNIVFSHYRYRDGEVEAFNLSQKFWHHMTDAYLRGYTHDFFYMTRREE